MSPFLRRVFTKRTTKIAARLRAIHDLFVRKIFIDIRATFEHDLMAPDQTYLVGMPPPNVTTTNQAIVDVVPGPIVEDVTQTELLREENVALRDENTELRRQLAEALGVRNRLAIQN